MRYVSSQTAGSYEESYFSISFGALKFGGYFSPRIIGSKHLGPSRLSDPMGSPSPRLFRVCRRSSGWRARQLWLLMMWVRALMGCPLAATRLVAGLGSLVESAAFTGRCWSCSGSGGGQLRVFAAAGRPLEAALLPEECEYTRPAESAPAFCCSTAFASRALTYWICRAPSPVAVMVSAAARPATRLSIGVENSGRPFASRSREETTIRGWSLGGVPLGGGGAPLVVDPGGGRALPPGGAFSQIARSATRAGSFSSSKFRARPWMVGFKRVLIRCWW